MATFISVPGKVTIHCADPADRAKMITALNSAGWAEAEHQFRGLTLTPSSRNQKHINRVVKEISAAGAKISCEITTHREWSHSVLTLAGREASPTIEINGVTLEFNCFGKYITITEDDPAIHGSRLLGHEGESARFAYYSQREQ